MPLDRLALLLISRFASTTPSVQVIRAVGGCGDFSDLQETRPIDMKGMNNHAVSNPVICLLEELV